MPIHALRPDEVAHFGISRTYQNIRLFKSMTAIENILVGQHNHLRVDLDGRHHPDAGPARGGGGGPQGGAAAAGVRRAQGPRRQPGRQAPLRRSASAGGRPRPRQQAAPAAPRRADGRDEPVRDPPDDRLLPQASRRAGDHHPAHRARDARGDGDLRQGHGAGLRPEDRRGDAAGDPAGSTGDRGVSRPRRGRRGGRGRGRPKARRRPGTAAPRRRGPDGHARPVRHRTSTPSTAASTPCAASRWTCSRARSSR